MDRETRELERAIERIWEIGRSFGLDPFATNFEIVPAAVMYEIGSYALPGRYSHWTFGKAYHRMKMMYDFGLSRIYEVVINSDPSYGFLLETNSPLQNMLVVAHVMGHVDFFKNNSWFSRTNRRMVDDAATHAKRLNEYEFKHGRKVVEQFLDAVLSIEEHVDPNAFLAKDAAPRANEKSSQPREGKYDDLLSPHESKKTNTLSPIDTGEPPVHLPEKDLLHFLANHSPILEPWQRDVVSMIRDEMLYFVPQMQTKTINEGWACLTGDSLVLSEFGLIRFDELYGGGARVGVATGNGAGVCPITDVHKEERVPTILIRTERGFSIEGALKHRVLLADGRWAFLDDVKPGDRVVLDVGANVWPTAQPRADCAPTAAPAPDTQIPDCILRSPKAVVSAFLRGYFDAYAHAGCEGVVFRSSSAELVRVVQLLLLNYGILSTQRRQQDGPIHLEITNAAAARFLEEIDFDLSAKREALRAYVEACGPVEADDTSDEIVAIEHGCADVYDITVAEKHAYVANGMVHHNSFWHSRIMRELDLNDTQHLEFAELHSSVVSPHKGQLNPYFLGYKILEDIERRWDRDKLFEVREIENDVSLLRNYLTEDLVEELDLFVFQLVDGEEWTVTEKNWERVRDQLVANMTNFGFPYIEVTDGDYHGNRELYLMHRFEGTELDMRYARKTLEKVQMLWGRPVYLETVVDDEPSVLRFDGSEHSES